MTYDNAPDSHAEPAGEPARLFEDLLAENARLRTEVASLVLQRDRLAEAVETSSVELRRAEERGLALERQLLEADRERRDFTARYIEVEQQNMSLANLFVATQQLHSTMNRDEVLNAIQEIIINLVGSEELAIYLYDANSDAFRLGAAFGIEARPQLDPADPLALTAASGQVHVSDAAAEGQLVACIPLRLDGVRVGVIGIYRLLPHKRELQSVDYELFELLSSHAAAALLCSTFHRPGGTAA